MLLNEFLKEHKRMQVLEATLVQQQKAVAALIDHINEQDFKIQKVSDEFRMRSATSPGATRQQTIYQEAGRTE
jgi:uncharacterized coiled-coil protein SlyX